MLACNQDGERRYTLQSRFRWILHEFYAVLRSTHKTSIHIVKKMLPTVLGLLLLTACHPMSADIQSLLYAPTINKQQDEVYAALERLLNLDEIIPKYPQRGEHRSAYVFYDMDGDGLDEAIFFYSYAQSRENTHALVLRQDASGHWQHVRDIATGFGQVDFVDFARMLPGQSVDMVVGWQNTSTQTGQVLENYLGIYALQQGDIVTELAGESYWAYRIHDFDGDGLEEAVLVARDPQSMRMQISQIRAVGNHLVLTDTLPLNNTADGLIGDHILATGTLWNQENAVYIDQRRENGTYATEVIQVGADGLKVLAGGNAPVSDAHTPSAWKNYLETVRSYPVLSKDYAGSGKVLVPAEQTDLPGNLQEGAEEPLMFTRFMELTADGMEITQGAVLNQKEGYIFFMPEDWWDWVSVLRSDDDTLWQFFVVDIESPDPNIEVLRIEAYSDMSGESGNLTGKIALGSRGSRHFSGYIPLRFSNAPTITEEQLKENFQLLS